MTSILGALTVRSLFSPRILRDYLERRWSDEAGSLGGSAFLGKAVVLGASALSLVALTPALDFAHDTAAQIAMSDVQVAQEAHHLIGMTDGDAGYADLDTLAEDGFVKHGVIAVETGAVSGPDSHQGDGDVFWVLSASRTGTVYLQLSDQVEPIEIGDGQAVPDVEGMTPAQEQELSGLADQLRAEATESSSSLGERLGMLRDAGQGVVDEVQEMVDATDSQS